jgi:hypothetical protein
MPVIVHAKIGKIVSCGHYRTDYEIHKILDAYGLLWGCRFGSVQQ